MTKTLRLTSLLVAVAAGCFLVLPVVLGAGRGRIADLPVDFENAIEKFKNSKGKETDSGKGESSPLVKEAEAFALYLNPPAKPKAEPSKTGRRKPSTKSRPKNVSVKFTLIGTSYFAANPALSLALIDEPGKGLRWIRQGGKLGHLIVERIDDGCIFVKDGAKSIELVAERPEKISLVKGRSDSQSTPDKDASVTVTVPVDTTDAVQTEDDQWPTTQTVEMTEEQRQAQLKDMFAELMAIQAGKDRQDDANSEPEDMRISEQEQQKLENVGEKLGYNRVPPEVRSRRDRRQPPQHKPPWANR